MTNLLPDGGAKPTSDQTPNPVAPSAAKAPAKRASFVDRQLAAPRPGIPEPRPPGRTVWTPPMVGGALPPIGDDLCVVPGLQCYECPAVTVRFERGWRA